MAFQVRLFTGAVDFEALHVAKLTSFPLEPRDYKPYSQVRICFAADGLHLQLLSFEASPLPKSRMTAVLALGGKFPLSLSLDADGASEAVLAGTVDTLPMTVHTFGGEDLQGVYWGGNLFVDRSSLRDRMGFLPELGAVFAGNFYKLCTDLAKPHSGSFYPADFTHPLHDPRNLGEFRVIDY